MSPKLQTLIQAAQDLSPLEQLTLIKSVSEFLTQAYPQQIDNADFWHPLSLAEILSDQTGPAVDDLHDLQVNFWPEDESADDMITYIYQQRQEDSLLEQ